MRVSREGDVISLLGHCRVEDAESLTALLQASPGVGVDLSGCESLHAAVVQVILAFEPSVFGAPADPFLRSRLAPALARKRQPPGGEL